MKFTHALARTLGTGLLGLLLGGCNLQINVVGEGRVTSETENIDCTKNCTKRSVGDFIEGEFEFEAQPGYELIGYVVDFTERNWLPARYTYQVYSAYDGTGSNPFEYGATVMANGYSAYPKLLSYSNKTTAIFHPKEDIEQVTLSRSSVCLISKTEGLTCWGKSATLLPENTENASAIITDTTPYSHKKDNLCMLTPEDIQCWNEHTKQRWPIPEHITNPISAAISNLTLCVLQQGATSNREIHCVDRYGTTIDHTFTLHQPTNLRANAAGGFCVDEGEETQCWGDYFYGQATLPNNLDSVSAFAVGNLHSCAISNHTLSCWGSNKDGQLDIPDSLNAPSQVSAGSGHTCVYDQPEVICWGNLNTRVSIIEPEQFQKSHLSSSLDTMCTIGVVKPGMPYCENAHEGALNPPDIPHTTSVAMDDARSSDIVGLGEGGLYHWNESFLPSNAPLFLSNPTLLAAGSGLVCVNSLEGFNCWRRNHSFGTLNLQPNSAPMNVLANPSALSFRKTSIGGSGCAIENTEVQCWGSQLGGQFETPEYLPPMIDIQVGLAHTCALSVDQQLFCWGETPVALD